MVENVNAFAAQVAIRQFLPHETVVRNQHRPPEGHRAAHSAHGLHAVVELAGKSENNALRTISAAVQAANRATQAGNGGSATKSVLLNEQNLEPASGCADDRCQSRRSTAHHAHIRLCDDGNF